MKQIRWSFILGFFILSSCASKPSGQNLNWQSCGTNSDQAATFMAPLESRSVQVVMDPGFSPSEQDEINRAVNGWNDFGNSSFSQNYFNSISGPLPNYATSSDPRDCNLLEGSGDSVPIVKVTDESRWNALGLDKTIPGATFRCYANDVLVRQVVLVFSPIIPEKQLMSVILHELGHSIGLDHSCRPGAGTSTFRGCTGLPVDHPYRVAVMAPTLRLGLNDAGDPLEKKEVLQANDTDRAECLYKNL